MSLAFGQGLSRLSGHCGGLVARRVETQEGRLNFLLGSDAVCVRCRRQDLYGAMGVKPCLGPFYLLVRP